MPPTLSKRQKVAIVIALCVDVKVKRKKRRMWTKDWLLKRQQLSHVNLLRQLDDDDYRSYLRLNNEAFTELLNLVRPYITKQDTIMREAVTAEERLIVTLKYLATGRAYADLRFSAAISAQLLPQIIPETCEAICKVLKGYIEIPKTENEWLKVARQYERMWQFNHCIGSMDGKHITIVKPTGSGSLFYNYKGTFSVVLFAVVNANYEFLYVHTGTNGSVSDGGILKATRFYQKLIEGELTLPQSSLLPESNILAPYVFIGDSAFALHEHVLKPYPQKNITHDKRIFNYRLSRARRVVENVFGILATRFRVFQKPILVDIENVDKIIMASCLLHNYLRRKSINYITNSCVDNEDVENYSLQPGQWRLQNELLPLQSNNQRQQTEAGKQVRNMFTTYFNGPGSVHFQERMVNVLNNHE